MSILEDMYNGKIYPLEDIVPQDVQYRPVCKEMGKEQENLLEKLTAEGQEVWKKYSKLLYKYEQMNEYANFACGFRMGAILVFEIFAEEGYSDKWKEENEGKKENDC
ncbi:MAG: hypothetical protein J6D08_14125 [Lachnospiraceae bacterium]|nr:hypothetical protein [Lachnospiraceae bacterium]